MSKSDATPDANQAAPNDALRARLRGAAFLAVMAAFGAVGTYAAHGSMPANPFPLPGEESLQMRVWAPEGWRFFTRPPQEEEPSVFSRGASGGWTNASLGANAEPRNAFGMDRRGRAQGVEIGLLMSEIPKSAWVDCEIAPSACIDRGMPVVVKNISPVPSLCGHVAVALQKPVPWAWSRSGRAMMPSRVARLEVQC